MAQSENIAASEDTADALLELQLASAGPYVEAIMMINDQVEHSLGGGCWNGYSEPVVGSSTSSF